MGVCGNGPTLVPVLADGSPGPLLFWSDAGSEPLPGGKSLFLPRVRWFQKHHRDLFHQVQFFLGSYEYLSYRLGAVPASVIPRPAFAPYVWDDRELALYGLDGPGCREKFPSPLESGRVMGQVSPGASRRWGLPEGIPIGAGGADYQAALLGTASVEPGRICDRAGTSEGINYTSGSPPRGGGGPWRVLPHPMEGLTSVAGILFSTGRIFNWYRRITGQTGENGQPRQSYCQTFDLISRIEPAAESPLFYPRRQGQGGSHEFSGGAFLGLEPHHGPGHLGRAVVEAIGFNLREILDEWEALGLSSGELRVSGGQGRSPVWNQMKADITGRRVVIPAVADAELLGAAVCAGRAAGWFSSLKAGAEALYRPRESYDPDPVRAGQYGEALVLYRSRGAEAGFW